MKQPRKIQCNKDYNNTPSFREDGVFYCSIYNPKIIQISLKSILSGKADIHQEAFFAIPFFETAIVEQLQVVLNDERHDVMLQALLKEDQAAYTAIPVPEGMDARSKATWKATMSSKVLEGNSL